MNITRQGDARYERVRRSLVWNARLPARYPEVIVQPETGDDVREALGLASQEGLRVAVRSGGHSWPCSALRNDTVLIDMRHWGDIDIHPDDGEVAAGPAVTVRGLARTLALDGLAFPTGHCPSVALGGYLLAGGWGWNSQRWGPACHSVIGVDVVTADGEYVAANAEHHAELLYAARGAGPAFPAVVTSFRLQAYRHPAAIVTAIRTAERESIGEVARWAELMAPQVPLGVKLGLKLKPAARRSRGRSATLVVSATAFAESEEAGLADLAFLCDCPAASAVEYQRFTDLAPLYDAMAIDYPEGHRYAADTIWSDAAADDVILALAERVAAAPSSSTFVTLAMPRRGLPEAPPPGAALSMYGALFAGCYAIWRSPRSDRENLQWLEATMQAVGPMAAGHYVGEMDLLRWPAARAYSPGQWQRLCALRRQLDPKGLFASPLSPNQCSTADENSALSRGS